MHTSTPPSMIQKIVRGFVRLSACALLVGGTFLMTSGLQAQDAAPAAEASAAPVVHQHTLMDRFHEGGWIMYPLLLCSIALVWLTVDLWMRTSIKSMAPPSQVTQVQDLFRAGDYVGAYQFCRSNNSYFADITRVGLSFVGEGQEAVEAALFSELNKTNSIVQTRINYLSVLGVCTPMIGLVGTVTGMMSAFATLGTSGVGDPSKLSAAIGEVLVATASGLAVAVPAFMIFYFLRNRLQVSMHGMQEIVSSLFRKMPYEHLKDAQVGEEEFYAAVPNWVTGNGEVQAVAVAVG
ncbi:biopolymer transport protein ExbB [Prosthecobacter fusiformis]|uniref:Biopolymer transport protein ExbB n=1 Tax=Prosthecobacter fusiformis TaxID=48464 RepID=A0A4R7RIK7_9BACT|nr:MotA/TolQ/ExbB proton channel family protein [Prosthecobacter fusiformis]TDU63177.1 biopolymer transport protein ExbB [Prosthecobacter fusiformis]